MKEKLLKFYLDFRLYIFPAVVGFSCIILIVFVIYPQTEKLILNQKAKSEIISRFELLEAKASSLENINEQDLERKLTAALTSLPAESDFSVIIGILGVITNANGFSVSGLGINPTTYQVEDGTSRYGVTTQVLGPQDLLPRLTKAIESSPRIMKVKTLEVSKNPEGGVVTVSLGLEVLFAPASTTLAGVDSPLPSLSQEDEDLLTSLTSIIRPSQITIEPIPSGPKGKANPFE